MNQNKKGDDLKHLPLFLLWYMHIKKEGYLPRHPIFINLKSNTMKNTVQMYDFLCYIA